jgi:hypothetical protein
MRDPIDIQNNQTGIAVAPDRAAEMMEGIEQFTAPEGTGLGEVAREAVRVSTILEAEPAATMPPARTDEAAASVLASMQGKDPAVLLDAMGARLAFERSGVRLYEALITKARALSAVEGGPSVDELLEIHNDELAHFQILQDAVQRFGGDPTAVTPGANREGVLSLGPLQVISDPRFNLRESLHAALLVELSDNDNWEMLIDTARSLGQEDLAQSFENCLSAERQHLARVRAWVSGMTERLAAHAPEPESGSSPAGT